MPSQHSRRPVSWRAPAEVEENLRAYSERTGLAVNAMITVAVEQLLERLTAEDAEREPS